MKTKRPIVLTFTLLSLVWAAIPAFANTHAAAPMPQPQSISPAVCSTNILTAGLGGANNVPPNSSAGNGIVRLSVNPTTGEINGQWTISDLTNITAAHIHQAAAGANGPIVLPFSGTPSNGGTFTTSNTDMTVANNILANPNGFYTNVHTATFPGGEIRGQLICEVARLFLPLAAR
jgi:hypothetical protein